MFKKKNENKADDVSQNEDVVSIENLETKAVSNDSDALDDSVVAEEVLTETVKKLRAKLKALEAEKQEYLIGWQRAKADLINARKRDEEDRKDFIKFSNERLIEEFIPVLASFDMAMGNKEAWEKADKNWRTGVEYIHSQLLKVLTDNGLKELNPINEKFDHVHHEASVYEPVSDEKQDHLILQVIQKGYSLNGKILKAPIVKVGEFRK